MEIIVLMELGVELVIVFFGYGFLGMFDSFVFVVDLNVFNLFGLIRFFSLNDKLNY